MDAARFATFMTEDGVFRFGNGPASVGRPAIEAGVAGFFAALGGLAHRIHGSWTAGDRVFVQGEVTYTRRDGTAVTLPFLNLLEMRGGLINRYLVYADINPVWNPAG
jgi:ketosteroid isomerase-like protein